MGSPRSTSPVAGRYELRELIGRGGMGEVYAAWDRQLEREVALKRLRADVAHHRAMRERVEAEARAAAQVIHPNVVTVFDSGVEDGYPFIVMERLEGWNLADELRKGAMGTDAVHAMTTQVLDALDAAHKQGLIHRDVKPSNVLGAPEGCWKVADFGIAKSVDSELTLTATNEVLGSPAYLAPERLTGAPATERTDLYAVGVLMYEALAGRRPFADDHPMAIAMAVREGAYEPLTSLLPGVDRSTAKVVERAMALEPEQRFASAREMTAALHEATEGVDIEGTQPISRMTTTQPLPLSGSAEAPALGRRSESTTPQEPEPTAAPEKAEHRSPRKVLGVVLVATLLTMVLLTVGAVAMLSSVEDEPARTPAAQSVPGAQDRVPDPLLDALDRLEEAIGQ